LWVVRMSVMTVPRAKGLVQVGLLWPVAPRRSG